MEEWVGSDEECPLPSCSSDWSNHMDGENQVYRKRVTPVSLDSLQAKVMILVSSRVVANSQVSDVITLRNRALSCVLLGGFYSSSQIWALCPRDVAPSWRVHFEQQNAGGKKVTVR